MTRNGSKFRFAIGFAALALPLAGCAGDAAPPAPPPSLGAIALDTLYRIGAEQGESWESFGGIWDVKASPSGRLALLDIDTGQAHVYAADGTHIGSITETGAGEGALDQPSGFAWSGPDELLVWDPGASWISRFGVGGEGVQFEDRQRAFAFGETGFCAHGDRVYLSYWQDGLVVHEMGEMGVENSFGEAPEIPGMASLGPELQEIGVEELSPSMLMCTDDGVLDAAYFGSHVRYHDLDGTLRWERDLDDFNALVVFTPDGMGLGRQFDGLEGTHLLQSVTPWGEGYALIQHKLQRDEFPQPGEVEEIESRLIRLDDGQEMDRTRALPLILDSWGRRLYMADPEPYPHVVVAEIRG